MDRDFLMDAHAAKKYGLIDDVIVRNSVSFEK